MRIVQDDLELHVESKIRRMTIVLYTLATIFVLTAAIFARHALTDSGEGTYDPLGEYPVQVVEADEILRDGTKAVFITGPVVVEGTKCNDTNEEVEVEGVISWQAVDPPGNIIETGTGRGVRISGCTTQVFQNAIPDAVYDILIRQYERGITAPVWRLTGTDWPIDEHGHRGESRRYKTENFAIVGVE